MVEKITLRRTRNQEELVMDMVSTPDYVLESVDWGTITGKHHSNKYVNQVGESITGSSLGMRPITIKGWIVAKDEFNMTTLKRKLNAFVNPLETIDLFYSDYTIQFVPDETVKYSIGYVENNDIIAKFQISGTCPNPLFANTSETRIAFVTTNPTFHFPLILSSELPDKGVVFGKRIATLIANVVNDGAVSVGARIVFRANGTVVNPSLLNAKTQERLLINKTLVSGEEVVVNTNIGEKSVKGKIGNSQYENYFMYKDIDSPWLQLEIGDNLFKYEADEGANNLDIFIYFYNRYLEVQECY